MQRMCRHHLREGKVSRIYGNLSDIWYNQLCLHYWEQGQQWQSTCSQDWTWWVPQYQVQSIHKPVVPNCKALIRFLDFFLPLHSLTIIFQLLEKPLVSASCSNSTKNCMTSTGCQWVAGLWIVLYHGCRNSAEMLHLYIGTTRKAMLHSWLTAGVTASTASLTAQESRFPSSSGISYRAEIGFLLDFTWVCRSWFYMVCKVMVLPADQETQTSRCYHLSHLSRSTIWAPPVFCHSRSLQSRSQFRAMWLSLQSWWHNWLRKTHRWGMLQQQPPGSFHRQQAHHLLRGHSFMQHAWILHIIRVQAESLRKTPNSILEIVVVVVDVHLQLLLKF